MEIEINKPYTTRNGTTVIFDQIVMSDPAPYKSEGLCWYPDLTYWGIEDFQHPLDIVETK